MVKRVREARKTGEVRSVKVVVGRVLEPSGIRISTLAILPIRKPGNAEAGICRYFCRACQNPPLHLHVRCRYLIPDEEAFPTKFNLSSCYHLVPSSSSFLFMG